MPISTGSLDIGVVLVDDHPYARAGVRRMLDSEPGISILGEGASGPDALRLTEDLGPAVVLLDIEMPGMSGLDVARVLAERDAPSRIVMLTVSDDAEHVAEAILAGAAGYVVKGASAGQIAFAVRSAAAGNVFLSPLVTANVLARWMPVPEPPPDAAGVALSVRELAVLRLLADGRDNGAIAAQLHISPNTVRRHVQSILDKLDVDNRTQAAVYAIRQGLT